MELTEQECKIIENLLNSKKQEFVSNIKPDKAAALADQDDLKTPFVPLPHRDPAIKQNHTCIGCRKPEMVYPSRLKKINNNWVYVCNNCVERGLGLA